MGWGLVLFVTHMMAVVVVPDPNRLLLELLHGLPARSPPRKPLVEEGVGIDSM